MKKSKALLSLAVALCIGAASTATSFAAEEVSFCEVGDYNADSVVDVSDVTAMQLHLARISTVADSALGMTDFDGDGITDVCDVTQLQLMLVGANYNCFVEADDAFKGVALDMRTQALASQNQIEFEEVVRERNLVYSYGDDAGYRSERFLIKSQDELYSLFGGFSSEFDQAFFEENALFVVLENDTYYTNYHYVTSMAVEGDTLLVDLMHEIPTMGPPACAFWHIFYRVDKDAVSQVKSISEYNDVEYIFS